MNKARLKKTLRAARCLLLGTTVVLALAVLFIELAVNFWGYPAWVRRRLENAVLPPEKGLCIIGWLKGGPITGFEIEDLIIDLNTPVGIAHVEVPSLELRLSLSSLLAFEAKPTRLTLRDAKTSLHLDRKNALTITGLTGQLRLNAHDTLQSVLVFQSAGINLRLNSTVYNCTAILDERPKTSSSPELQLAELQKILTKLHDELSQASFGTNDTFLNASIRTDLLDLEKTTIQGEYGMNDAIFHDIVVPKQRAHFQYAAKSLEIEDLQILLSSNEIVRATAEYDFRSQQLRTRANGRIFPDTITRLANCPPGTFPEWLHFLTPIEFEATLNHTGNNWAALEPSIQFSCGEFQTAGLPIRKCTGKISLQEDTLRLDEFTCDLDYRQRETIHGSASWNFKNSELSGKLAGTVYFPRIAQDLGLNATRNPILASLSQTTFDLTLHPSPPDWKRWSLEGELRQPLFQPTNGLDLQDTFAKFSLQNGELNLTGLETHTLLGQMETTATATLQCRLTQLLQHRKAPVLLHTWLKTAASAEPVLETAATLYLDLRKNTISLENGLGGVYPHTICNLLEPLLQIDPAYRLDWLHSTRPGVFEYNITPWNFGDWDNFQLKGEAHFDECVFQNIPLETLETQFTVTARDFQMTSFHFCSEDNQHKASGNFTIEYLPFAITLKDIEYQGDPIDLTPLIVDPDAIAIYRDIWTPFTWKTPAQAKFQLGLIEFRQLPAQRSWLFQLQGFASLEEFRYRQVDVPKASCRLDLTLPDGGLNILDVVLDSQDDDDPTRLTGEAHLQFQNEVSGRFDLHFHEGELDTLKLLKNVAETLAPLLEPFELSHKTYFDLHGNFLLGTNPFLRLVGSIESPFVKFHDLELENVEAKCLATPQFLHWDCSHAKFFGGNLAATVEYNHLNGTGQLLATIKDIPLQELIRVTASTFHEHEEPQPTPKASKRAAKKSSTAKQKPPAEPDIELGLLDAEAKLAFFLNWANRPIHIEGNGRISIHDADLWHIPLLTSLGKIISVGTFHLFSRKKSGSLGTISKLKATVECQGKRIFFPEIKTNGTVVALTGSGEYDLEEKQMDFLISGQFLKNLSIINWLLRPLTWAFKAELVGKPEDYTWHLRSGWHKLEDKDND